ncbi:hypothetical protein D3C78_922930 [compost metagenome]
MKSGKIALFLDAFDEIDYECLQEVYADINLLCQAYKNLIVVVSSRPETIITQNSLFEIINLCPYTIEEQKGLIDKLIKNEDNKKILIETVEKSTHEVKEVLTTPLMVVLFIKQYVVGFSIPHHVADFYKNIFDVVTFTHDRSKGIEKRNSYSSLNQQQLEIIFERFCFETFLGGRNTFDKKEFIDLLKKSIEKNNINDFNDFNNLIYDYTRFACLILQDGNEYTFIHKSIQEYYVAKFIENLPENLAKKVIERKFNDNVFNNNYLNFLKILKPYFYNKYYVLKEFQKYKENINISFINDEENVNIFLNTLYLAENVMGEGKYLGINYVTQGFMSISEGILFKMVRILNDEGIVDDGIICWVNESIISNKAEKASYTPMVDLYNLEILKNINGLKEIWAEICSSYDKYLLDVYKIETSVSEDDLDI